MQYSASSATSSSAQYRKSLKFYLVAARAMPSVKQANKLLVHKLWLSLVMFISFCIVVIASVESLFSSELVVFHYTFGKAYRLSCALCRGVVISYKGILLTF